MTLESFPYIFIAALVFAAIVTVFIVKRRREPSKPKVRNFVIITLGLVALILLAAWLIYFFIDNK